jgi:hypothetical protein
MHIRRFMFIAVILSVVVIFWGCTSTTSPTAVLPPPGTSQPAQPGQTVQSAASSGTLTLSVGSLSPGSALPDVYTCKGASESPKVSWSGIPAGTKSLVLIVDDPDATSGTFTHWLVYNIPPGSGELAQGQSNAKVLSKKPSRVRAVQGSVDTIPPARPSVRCTAIFSASMRLIFILPCRPQTGEPSTRL